MVREQCILHDGFEHCGKIRTKWGVGGCFITKDGNDGVGVVMGVDPVKCLFLSNTISDGGERYGNTFFDSVQTICTCG